LSHWGLPLAADLLNPLSGSVIASCLPPFWFASSLVLLSRRIPTLAAHKLLHKNIIADVLQARGFIPNASPATIAATVHTQRIDQYNQQSNDVIATSF
jgi:hypothetical protein